MVFIYFVLINLFVNISSQNINKPVLIHETSKSFVWEITTENGVFRYVTLVAAPELTHGVISMDHVEHISVDYMKMILGALLLEPSPKHILFIGLGVGVLPRALNQKLSNAQIDVVEIDPDMLELAMEYFYFRTNEKLRVHIQDGFEYVMSLKEEQTYDLIVMDAFDDKNCAPDIFYHPKYVSKLKHHLTPNGIISVNTIPECARHNEELILYKNVFPDYYLSEKVAVNRIFFGFKGQPTQLKQIKKNAKKLNYLFNSLDVSTEWIINLGFSSL